VGPRKKAVRERHFYGILFLRRKGERLKEFLLTPKAWDALRRTFHVAIAASGHPVGKCSRRAAYDVRLNDEMTHWVYRRYGAMDVYGRKFPAGEWHYCKVRMKNADWDKYNRSSRGAKSIKPLVKD
jgi:hypothetical protein